MKNAPCKDCECRHPNCHSECEDYIQYSRERTEILNKKSNEQHIIYDNEIVHKRVQRWRRSVRNGRK